MKNLSSQLFKSFFFLMLLFFYLTEIKAQQVVFENYFDEYSNTERTTSLVQSNDGGYLMAGFQLFAPYYINAILIKTDSLGNVEWDKFYTAGVNSVMELNDILALEDGGYIGVGRLDIDNWNQEVLIMRFDEWGDTLWTKSYGTPLSDIGYSICQTSDGGFAVSTSWEDKYAGLLKINANGDSLWVKKYIEQNYSSSIAYSITSHNDEIIFTGTTYSGDPIIGRYVYTIKTDSLGNTIWKNFTNRTNKDMGLSICKVKEGGYIVSGATYHGVHSMSHSDIYLVRISELGNTLWTKVIGTGYEDVGSNILQTSDGGFLISSERFIPRTRTPVLVKTNNNGEEEWIKTYGPFGHNAIIRDVILADDGGFVLTGNVFRDTRSVDYRPYLIKTDSSGNALTTSVQNEMENKLNVNIYPNPFNDILNIDISGEEIYSINEIEIFDFTGKRVRHLQTQNNSIKIERGNLSQGIYILKINKENYNVLSKKIIVK